MRFNNKNKGRFECISHCCFIRLHKLQLMMKIWVEINIQLPTLTSFAVVFICYSWLLIHPSFKICSLGKQLRKKHNAHFHSSLFNQTVSDKIVVMMTDNKGREHFPNGVLAKVSFTIKIKIVCQSHFLTFHQQHQLIPVSLTNILLWVKGIVSCIFILISGKRLSVCPL